MTAPSVRSLGTVVKTTTAAPSFAAPAGAVSTDIIVISFFVDDGRRTVTAAPSGFTLGADLPQTNDVAAGSPSHSLVVYWGRYGTVGAGPYAFTISTSVFVEGLAVAVQGAVASGNPFEAADGNTSGNTSVTTAPAVSATSTGTDRLAFYAATNYNGGAWTPATGYTEQYDADDRIITVDTLTMASAATTSPQAVCVGSSRSNAWVGIMPPVASGSSLTADASLSATATLTASATETTAVNASLAATATLSAAAAKQAIVTASLATTATFTAAASRGQGATATLAVTETGTAAATVSTTANASLAATASFSSSAAAGRPGAATLTATASFTAAAARGQTADASLPVTATFTAAATAASPGSATAALPVTATFTAAAQVNASASATLPVTVTFAAAAARNQPSTAALAATVSFAASAQTASGGTAALSVTALFAAAATVTAAGPKTGDASLAVTVTLSAAASVQSAPRPQASGGWYGLVSVLRESRAVAAYDAARPPVACPHDGEPLRRSVTGVLYCAYDGYVPPGQNARAAPTGGDWGGMAGVLAAARADAPLAQLRELAVCPNDGELLQQSIDGFTYCPYDGFMPAGQPDPDRRDSS